MSTHAAEAQGVSRFFAIPAPLRSLFKIFPLKTYAPNALPHRSPSTSPSPPRLYVFADEDVELAQPGQQLSFNPSCLRYQTLLRIAGVDVELVPSNNHASPSGSLPFVLTEGGRPISGEKIVGWAREESGKEFKEDGPKIEAYRALISQAIRPAWLYALYLNPANYDLLKRLYLPSNPLLRLPTHQQLTDASTAEILKTTNSTMISPDQLSSEYRSALEALETLLGDDEWFFGGEEPGALDAEVFAYAWLVGHPTLGWGDAELGRMLGEFANLSKHRLRVYERCWGEKTEKA